MSAVFASDALLPDAPHAAAACRHCGETLAAVDVAAPAGYCCSGCEAAAAWISDAGLADYYRLRSERAPRVAAETADLAIWDRDDVQSEHAHDVPGGREITLLTDGMRCAACAWLIDRALMREPGVVEVSANAVTGRIRLTWNPAVTVLSAPLRRMIALGYQPYLAGGDAAERARRQVRNRDLVRLGLVALGAMQAMMFAEALYLDTGNSMSVATRDFFRWITFLVSTPVVFYGGWPFARGAWREIVRRTLGMDTLIFGSAVLAWAASAIETIRGGAHVWYDAALMFVFLLLAARLLEQAARRTASQQVDALARARPAFATRWLADGRREQVPLANLSVGETVFVAAGETAPADGVLLDDFARFEEALLTGESRPVAKKAGDVVFAGTSSRECAARIRITRVGAQTRLSELVRLVERAQSQRPALARMADRIASRFVAVMLVVAAIVFLGWHAITPERAFEVTLAMLVITCPCALSLSIPAALAASHAALAKLGVLGLRDGALLQLARVTDVVFDKTGTLTQATHALLSVQPLGELSADECLQLAAALEHGSTHPLASAFAADALTRQATQLRYVAGAGIAGLIDGREWRLGRGEFAGGAPALDEGLWLGDGTRLLARFEVGEALRGDAAHALDGLRAAGFALHLASGDSARAVDALAQRLGLVDARARQSPDDKLALVRDLQRRGAVVAMVGDGINDAPVLAGADVSMAFSGGAALAHQSADFVLTGASLARVPQAFAIARRTRRVIAQNLYWAVGYNLLALPLAAAGMVTPWLAALGMAASSLIVTLNALRLLRLRA